MDLLPSTFLPTLMYGNVVVRLITSVGLYILDCRDKLVYVQICTHDIHVVVV